MSRQTTARDEPAKRRNANLFDAVAGRVGVNGFLDAEQPRSLYVQALAPEEILLRNTNAAAQLPDDYHSADLRLRDANVLPGSDLLKAAHYYTTDFYRFHADDRGKHDFRSLDETALLAVGILLEEAAREMLGETGDMALVEPEGREDGLQESGTITHQISGKVSPRGTPEFQSEDSEEDVSPRKRLKPSLASSV